MSKYRNYSDDWFYNSEEYGEHVSAMTSEELHSKSEIAAELAYRDCLLSLEQVKNAKLVEALKNVIKTIDYEPYSSYQEIVKAKQLLEEEK